MENRLFKHMESKYLDILLNEGVMLINNLKTYQTIENVVIRDSDEGYKVMTETFNEQDFKIYERKEGDEDFVDVSNSPKSELLIRMGKMEVSQRQFGQDVYAYCTSLSSEKELFRGYDSCLEILDMNFFKLIGIELMKKRLITMTNVGDKEYLGIDGKIIYSKDKKIERSKKNILPHFVKDESFAKEQEYRMIYKAPITMENREHTLSPVEIIVPEISKYCQKIW